MIVKKSSLLVIFMAIFISKSIAQKASDNLLIREKVVLTTDRTTYFAGERVLMHTRCMLPGTDDSLSRVMYVELLDMNAKPIVQKKLQVTGGNANGILNIPADIITGNYYLRAYTQYMRNFDKSLFYTTELTIINPELKPKKAIQTLVKNVSDTLMPENETVQIRVPADSFLPNSPVTFEIDGKKQQDLSVSVVKKGSYDPAAAGVNRYFKTAADADSLEQLKWYPEIRSVSISGKLLDPQSKQPLKDMLVYASVIDSVKQFHIARTKADGSFIFALMQLNNNHQVYIGSEKEATILINPDFATGLPPADYSVLKMDSVKLNLINEMYTNEQITTIYQDEVPVWNDYLDTLPDPFRASLETVFFADYVALPTMTDMFNEIVPYTKVKNKKEEVVIQLADKKDKTFFDNSLVLIDNIPFHDHAAILGIAPSKINAVGVIPNKYVYGGEVINGVIYIQSKNGNLAGLPLPKEIVVVDYITYNPEIKPDYEKSAPFSENKPGFKNTLYWNPSVELINGKQQIQFYSGNDLSDYDIVVRGTDNQGNAFTNMKTIHIRKHTGE